MVIHHHWFCVLFSSASLSVPIQGFLCTSKWTVLKGMKGSRMESKTHRSQLASTEPSHHGTVCSQTSQNQFSQGTYCDFCLPGLPRLYLWPLRQIPHRKQWKSQHPTAPSDRNGHWTYWRACRTCVLGLCLGHGKLWYLCWDQHSSLRNSLPWAQDSQVSVRPSPS